MLHATRQRALFAMTVLVAITAQKNENAQLLKSYEQLEKIDAMEQRTSDASEVELEIGKLETKKDVGKYLKKRQTPPWGASSVAQQVQVHTAEDASLAVCKHELAGHYCKQLGDKAKCERCTQEHKSRIVYEGLKSPCTMADLDRLCTAGAQERAAAAPALLQAQGSSQKVATQQGMLCMSLLQGACTRANKAEAHVCRQCVHERLFLACTAQQKESFCPQASSPREQREAAARSRVMPKSAARKNNSSFDDMLFAMFSFFGVAVSAVLASYVSTLSDKNSVGSTKRNRSLAEQEHDGMPDFGSVELSPTPIRSSVEQDQLIN
jgi:hypothetical protein